MPGYFKKSLHQFNQLKPKNPQHQPYKSPERMYVADDQNMKPINTSPVLYTDQVKWTKKIVGNLLYDANGVDNTCLVPLIGMASIIDPTEQEKNNLNKFFDYMETHPNSVILFHASDTILCSNNDALYLNEPQARSCSAVYFFLWIIPSECAWEHLNIPVHVNCNILNVFAASAAEA